jgi:hypothetical protein
MVRCYIEKKNKDWDRDLPILATCMTLLLVVLKCTEIIRSYLVDIVNRLGKMAYPGMRAKLFKAMRHGT